MITSNVYVADTKNGLIFLRMRSITRPTLPPIDKGEVTWETGQLVLPPSSP